MAFPQHNPLKKKKKKSSYSDYFSVKLTTSLDLKLILVQILEHLSLTALIIGMNFTEF